MRRPDWARLERFADQHRIVSTLSLAIVALRGLDEMLGALPAPDNQLRRSILEASLRAAELRRAAQGATGGAVRPFKGRTAGEP